MPRKNCFLCHSKDEEITCVIKALKKNLKKLQRDYHPQVIQPYKSERHLILNRLLQILFGRSDSYYRRDLISCQHNQLMKKIKRKMKCNPSTFYGLCNQLLFKLAERNYHLQVLTLQIKNLAFSCKNIADNYQSLTKKHYQDSNLSLEVLFGANKPVVDVQHPDRVEQNKKSHNSNKSEEKEKEVMISTEIILGGESLYQKRDKLSGKAIRRRRRTNQDKINS